MVRFLMPREFTDWLKMQMEDPEFRAEYKAPRGPIKIERTEIIKVKLDFDQADAMWAIQTQRNAEGDLQLSLINVEDEESIMGDEIAGIEITIPFEQARVIAVGLLRAVYREMPSTWHLAEGDPQEYISHFSEIAYQMSRLHDPRDAIKNLLDIGEQLERARCKIGAERRKSVYWKRRRDHAAMWARQNHRKIVAQRRQLKALNEKIKEAKPE
jgi:hypothetical protein